MFDFSLNVSEEGIISYDALPNKPPVESNDLEPRDAICLLLDNLLSTAVDKDGHRSFMLHDMMFKVSKSGEVQKP